MIKSRHILLIASFVLFLLTSSCGKNQIEHHVSNSSWIITRVDYTQTNTSVSVQDTLSFVSDTKYTINNGDERNYTLVDNNHNQLRLDLNDCTTLGGNYAAYVNEDLIRDGELNGTVFFRTIGNENDLIVWMERLS